MVTAIVPDYPAQSGPTMTTMEKTRLSTLDKDRFVALVQADFQRMRRHSGRWRREAKEDFSFYAGDQWTDEDKGVLKEGLRPIITYNRVQPMIDAVSGLQVNNRQEVRYIPREQGDVGMNEVLTGASEWIRDQCDAEDEDTDAFLDCCICGMGWTETRILYDEDPDGLLSIDRTDPMEMYWDTASKKRNLTDARALARVRDYTEEEFANTWPEWAGQIAAESGQWDSGWTDDEGEAHFNDEIGYQGEPVDAGFDKDRRIYKVMEYQWVELEPYYRTVNPQTNQIEEVSIGAGNKLRRQLEALGIPLVKQKRRKYFKCFMVGEHLLERMESPLQTGFSYQPMTGKRDRNRRHWYGIVKNLKDPQRWANKFFSQILHVLNTNAKGGIMAEQSAFLDPEDAESRWAASDSITMMNDGALGQNPKVLPKPGAPYPQGTDRLMQHSLEAFQQVTGINLEMIGQADANNRSGILEYQRKESAVTILAPMFDALRRYRKHQGRISLEYIQKYLSDGRLVRIVGQDGTEQYVPLVKDEQSRVYDIIVDEAPTSPNQKEKVFQILSLLLPSLLQAGMPIPPDILDYSPLPAALVAKWKEMLQPKDGQEKRSPEEIEAQAKAQKEQSIAQLNQAKAQTEAAKAQAVGAQAQAQMARIMELTPVDQAQAAKFQAAAQLDEARRATEETRQDQMIADGAAGRDLIGEKMETEDARQEQLRQRRNGANNG